MPGSTPPTSQLDWLSSTTAMIVLFWSRATRDLLKSFGWGIAALHRLDAATKLPFPRRPPHSIFRSLSQRSGGFRLSSPRNHLRPPLPPFRLGGVPTSPHNHVSSSDKELLPTRPPGSNR